ncbi:hypothetical protein [Synechococcus sp. BA-132 BA5]|uniref:hypothetical protein n=1 Tax=Synechococcus sp. BA-132 BA5 TaxID=3110252 RepID=UPI002B201A31|nr:hypothetical protein [Synechococcus sp. BA-132 BA5]MEA5416309.1 hypothetical protein [Synechococcus sp. BA-132 BA5]
MTGVDRIDRSRRGLPMLPVVLLVLALIDLRVELMLLWDHLTWTSLIAAVQSHLLAVAVLVSQPSLWSHYRRSRG